MSNKITVRHQDFPDSKLPIVKALELLGERVKVDKRLGYMLDGKPVKIFAVLEAANQMPKEK